MLEFGSVFGQVAAVLAVCAVLAGLALAARLPLLFGLLVAGIVVGPDVLGLVEHSDEIELLASIGIALLLFVVGLKLDIRIVRILGPVALTAGLAQITLTVIPSYLIATAFGFDPLAAGYIAMAMAFSSTIIVVKVLTDRRELKVLHGRIAIGILIVQDLVVVLAMIALSGFAGDSGSIVGQVVGIVARGTVLLVGVALLARYVLPRVIHVAAHQAELLILAAVAWAVLMASVSMALGFSEEVGAFLAGVALASSPYRDAISGRLTALRDFLLVFFFIELGTTFELSAALARPGPAITLSAFVLIGKPLIVAFLTGRLGYRARTSFQSGITLGQISEFSLILVALGVSIGHVGSEAVGVVTAVALVTIGVSTMMVKGSDTLFDRVRPLITRFERDIAERDLADHTDHRPHVILLGLGRFGSALNDELVTRGVNVMGVDFDPRNRLAVGPEVVTVFGDAEDPELPYQLPLDDVSWVISSIRNVDANLAFLTALREHGFTGQIALSADDDVDERILADAGADAVFCPFRQSAGPVVSTILDEIHRADEEPDPH